MLQNNALIDTATARTYLGNTDAGLEPFIELGINTLSDAFDGLCGYQLIEQDYTGVVLNGPGDRLLRFPAFNVTAIAKIEYRASHTLWNPLPETLWETDAIHKRGAVGCGGFHFSAGLQNWRADYTAGWAQSDLPGAIREGMLYELKRFLERRPDINSEDMGGQSASGRTYASLREATRRALAPYMLTAM